MGAAHLDAATAVTAVTALNPLDPHSLLSSFGALGVFLVLFAETGLLVGFFLPGDSLLFTAGLLCTTTAGSSVHLSLGTVLPAAVAGALLGAQTGYLIGVKAGPPLLDRPGRPRLQQAVTRSREALERYGAGKAIVLARFIPLVRTVLNPLAGTVGVPVRTFTLWQVLGGRGLVRSELTLAGYALGSRIPNVDSYLLPIIAVIVVLSLVPVAAGAAPLPQPGLSAGRTPVNPLRTLDDRLMQAVNAFARQTGWLHAPVLAYATYGVVLFALLLLAGVLVARHRSDRTLAAAGWACMAPLLAVAVNQPVGHLFSEARPYAAHPAPAAPGRPDAGLLLPLRPRRHGRRGRRGPAAGLPQARAGGRRRRGAHGVRPGVRRGALPVGRAGRAGARRPRRHRRLAAAARPARRPGGLAARPARSARGLRTGAVTGAAGRHRGSWSPAAGNQPARGPVGAHAQQRSHRGADAGTA